MNTDLSQAFALISNECYTVFDFEKFMKLALGNKKLPILDVFTQGGHTVLHAIVEHNKPPYLFAIHRLGLWEIFRGQKVARSSEKLTCVGKDAREIAECVTKSRKLVLAIDEVDEWQKSMTTLHKLAREQNLIKLRKYIGRHPSLVNDLDSNGSNALYWACVSGNVKVVSLLQESGVKSSCVNKKGETLLHITCITGHSHLVQFLVKELNVPTDIKDKSGRTAISYTAENGDLETLKELLACRVHLTSELLPLSAFYGRGVYLKTLTLEHHVDLNTKDENGKTAFIRAAEGGRCHIIEDLVQGGIGWHTTDNKHRNALHYGAECQDPKVIELLVGKAKEANILKDIINSQDKYVGNELCFLIRGKDKGR